MKIHLSTGRAGSNRKLVIRDRSRGGADLRLAMDGNVWIVSTGSGSADDRFRNAGSLLAERLILLGEKKVYVDIPSSQDDSVAALLQGIVAQALDTTWCAEDRAEDTTVVQLVFPARALVREAVEKARRMQASLQWTVQMVQAPANHLSPQVWGQQIVKRLQPTCSVSVYDRAWLDEQRFGLMNAVGRAGREPALIHIRYRPESADQDKAPVLLVGKGITFDSGGLDLKPPAGMRKMKYDMAGGAAVAGVMDYISSTGLAVPVDAVIAAADNLVAQGAMMPGDVFESRSGLTVEIDNTDAEGRLVLADALHWGCESFEPSMVVSVATLTGAAVSVAGWHPVLTGRNKGLLDSLQRAGASEGEKMVPLPLWQEFGNELTSSVADLKNSTGTRRAGTLSAAAFLSRFVPAGKWGHIDIAASAWNEGAHPYFAAGPTGAGFRALAGWLESLAERS